MNCPGCYKKIEKNEYCLSCRKKLFDGKRVSTVLEFDKPNAENISMYNEHSKRISISGVQLKYSLKLVHNKLELCEKNGQYIIKPIPSADHLEMMDDAPENEHLTMQIASQIFNIKTAHNALIYFKDGPPAYITKRFDVKGDGTKYIQEDFAQITNRTKETHGESYKYDGSYLEIGELIKKFVPASMIAIDHLRNDFGEMELSPSYDLMSTIIHTPGERDTALDLYDKDHESAYYASYGHYGGTDFIEFAKRLGIVEVRYMRIINEFLEKEKEVDEFIQNSFLSNKALVSFSINFKSRIQRLY